MKMKIRLQKQLTERELATIGPRATKDPYSVDFAYQQASWLKTLYKSTQASIHEWEKALAEAEQYHIYDRIPPTKPYGNLETLLKAEIGVGAEEARIQILGKHGGDRKSKERDQGRDSTLNGKRDSAYLTARIAHDAQTKAHVEKVFERMNRGEFKSVRAVAIEAGIIKLPTVLDQLRKLWLKATAAEKAEFEKWKGSSS
jgi:hypothetical protein